MATVYEHKLQFGGRKHVSTSLRRGMWVLAGGRIGICNALFTDLPGVGLRRATNLTDRVTHVEFHLVDAMGATVSVNVEPVARIRQAALADIPVARRPDMKTAARFGYA